MQLKQNKKIIQAIFKHLSYWIAVIISFVVVIVIFLLCYVLYNKIQFIESCIDEGKSYSYCYNVWKEVDALN